MVRPDPAGVVLIAAVLGLAAQGMRLSRRWSIGRPAPVDWFRGLARLPRAYFHTVHDIVARDPFASRMHTLAAGGLVAALVLSFVLHVGRIGGAPLAVLIVLAVLLSLVGTAMVAWRRRPPRPARLTGGTFDVLPAALAGTLAFLLLAAFRDMPPGGPEAPWIDAGSMAIALLGAVSLGLLVGWTVHGPMRHALAGVVHLVAHTRPRRFADAVESGLKPLTIPESWSGDGPLPRLGIGTAADFGWNRLAQFDSCVQCGRCQEACPAYAAGQPLNPKRVIQDLVRAIAPSGPGATSRPLVAGPGSEGFIAPDALWACTTCRACVYECPMLIEHVDAIVDMRRFQTLEEGSVPPNSAAALAEIRATDTVSGRALESRLDWAVDLHLPLMAQQKEADVLLWLGEGAFERRSQRTLRALVGLLRRAEVDFGVLGDEELDCGDLARRLGDEVTFQHLATRNIATLSRYRFGRILTADPHALHVIRNEYPAFGGGFEVVHHTAFLDELLQAGALKVGTPDPATTVTYHDPCYLGRYNGEIAAPRRLLDRIGLPSIEMPFSGMRSRCCGGGGGAPLADVAGDRRIPDIRMDQARTTGARTLAVACPTCAVMLEGVVGPKPAVADLAELVLAAVEAADIPERAEVVA